MKYKLFALAMVIVLLSAGAILLCPDNELKWRDLQDIDAASAARAQELSGHENVTVTDLAAFELLKCRVPEDQLGKYPDDWRSMASSTGITDNISRGWDEAAHKSDLNNAINDSMPLAQAFFNGVSEPFFAHGEAQPVFRFTSSTTEGYTNANSSILRYCVYVETEYDTDSDGKRDLVKVYLQVPKAAMEGKYKAPVIMRLNPYSGGTCRIDDTLEFADSYDLSKLYSQPDRRTVKGYESAIDLAYATDKSDWEVFTGVGNTFGYFLSRGYAVASCAGLGTNSSEGLEVCGTDIELKCFKKVIEWFDGNATAFTDRERCIETRAEWSDGDVGTIGISYLGTLQVGLAAMGCDNLRTIVAQGAISNWYEYSHSQGARFYGSNPYQWYLTQYCSSRYLSLAEFPSEYQDYIKKIGYDEKILEGEYTDGTNTFWEQRDYTRNVNVSDTAVLLVHGLNDTNVKTKQFDMSYKMFTSVGMDVHAILHQGGHMENVDKPIMIDGMNSMQLLNRWYSCYLFEINNGIADDFRILVQSNIDASWKNYENLDSVGTESYGSKCTGTYCVDLSEQEKDPVVKFESDGGRYVWNVDTATQDTTIIGVPKITFKASTKDVESTTVKICACMYDVCDEEFPTYKTVNNLVEKDVCVESGVWVGSNCNDMNLYEFRRTSSVYKEITSSILDMHFPDSRYESYTAVREQIVPNQMYEYELYLNPTIYTLEEGHHLEIVFYAYNFDQDDSKLLDDYSYTIDLSSLRLEIGTV